MEEQIDKYFRNELSPEEKLNLLRLVQSEPTVKQQFIRVKNLHALISLQSQSNDETVAINSLRKFKYGSKLKKTKQLLIKTMSAAAVILLLIGGTWLSATHYISHISNQKMHTLTVPAGQRACITLDDGSSIWVNAKSTLTYPAQFSTKERKVTLVGEAYFTVQKEKNRPFIVSANDVEVEVLGTTFNICNYPETKVVQTSLVEGSIKLTSTTAPTQSIVLLPQQEAIRKNGKFEVHTLQASDLFLWKDGIYSFDNTPFSELIKKLQLYYDVAIEVVNPEILDFEYSGKFRQRDGILQILQILQKIKKFKIEVDEEINKITLKS